MWCMSSCVSLLVQNKRPVRGHVLRLVPPASLEGGVELSEYFGQNSGMVELLACRGYEASVVLIPRVNPIMGVANVRL